MYTEKELSSLPVKKLKEIAKELGYTGPKKEDWIAFILGSGSSGSNKVNSSRTSKDKPRKVEIFKIDDEDSYNYMMLLKVWSDKVAKEYATERIILPGRECEYRNFSKPFSSPKFASEDDYARWHKAIKYANFYILADTIKDLKYIKKELESRHLKPGEE